MHFTIWLSSCEMPVKTIHPTTLHACPKGTSSKFKSDRLVGWTKARSAVPTRRGDSKKPRGLRFAEPALQTNYKQAHLTLTLILRRAPKARLEGCRPRRPGLHPSRLGAARRAPQGEEMSEAVYAAIQKNASLRFAQPSLQTVSFSDMRSPYSQIIGVRIGSK
jgi:hypothetical protein